MHMLVIFFLWQMLSSIENHDLIKLPMFGNGGLSHLRFVVVIKI